MKLKKIRSTVTTAALGYAAWKGVQKLMDGAKETPIPGVDGQPYANSQYFTSGKYTLHYRFDPAKGYEARGKIFMLHGFACNTTFYDELVEIYTKQGFDCLRVDSPNFGFSTRETSFDGAVDREDLFFELLSMFDASGRTIPGKWILMGHSMGGGISMNMAYENPDAFSCVVLYTPMGAVSMPAPLKNIIVAKPLANIINTVFKVCMSSDAIVKVVMLLMTINPEYVSHYDPRKFGDSLTVPDTGTGLCYMTADARPTNWKNNGKVNLPIQLTWASIDLFNMPSTVRRFQESLKDPEVVTIKGAGHCVIQDRADEVSANTLAFFQKHGI